jgi:hypothetical protein
VPICLDATLPLADVGGIGLRPVIAVFIPLCGKPSCPSGKWI